MEGTTTRIDFEPVKYRDIVVTLDRPELFKIIGLTVGLALVMFAVARFLGGRRATRPLNVAARIEASVRHILDHIDRLDGLITVKSFEGRVVALVENRGLVPTTKAALLEFDIPQEILDVYSVTDYLIPYPNDDERLMAWFGWKSSDTDERSGGEAAGV
jgi:hypothetical protein